MKHISYTYYLLLSFILLLAIFSIFDVSITFNLILLFTVMKFLLVAFNFMEIKIAHNFWKFSIAIFLALFVILILFI